MKIHDLAKPLDELTDEELLERLRAVRARREIERPVARRKAAVAEKKTVRKNVAKVEDLFDTLTPEQREALIKQLEG